MGSRTLPRWWGGFTPASAIEAVEFYSQFVDKVIVAAGTREAEMAKLLENTYRQVNIALVNEMAKFSHELDIDIWDVIACASSKPFGFAAFYPGPGVGGHCIPIDPSYLSHRVQAELGYPFRFVELAQEVNRSMPRYVRERAQKALNERGLPMRDAEVLLLGVTYKAGVADQRESPATPLAKQLLAHGATLSFYDRFVDNWTVDDQEIPRVRDLTSSLASADLVIHLQPHDDYSASVLTGAEAYVLDTQGILQGENIERL